MDWVFYFFFLRASITAKPAAHAPNAAHQSRIGLSSPVFGRWEASGTGDTTICPETNRLSLVALAHELHIQRMLADRECVEERLFNREDDRAVPHLIELRVNRLSIQIDGFEVGRAEVRHAFPDARNRVFGRHADDEARAAFHLQGRRVLLRARPVGRIAECFQLILVRDDRDGGLRRCAVAARPAREDIARADRVFQRKTPSFQRYTSPGSFRPPSARRRPARR